MAFPERGNLRPKYAAAGGGGGGGAPQPPDVNATIRQIADQSASQAIAGHEQTKPHVDPTQVRRLANEQHAADPHTGLAQQSDVDALSGRVDDVEHRVDQLEHQPAPAPIPPQPVTPQAVADAVRQDPQPFVVAIRPHLPAGGGTGLSEAEIRTLAQDEVNKSAAAQRPDGWTNPMEVEQAIQDAIDDGTLANGTDLTALRTSLTAIEGRLPTGTDPITVTTLEQQRQTLATLFGIPVADLDAAHIQTRMQEWAQQGTLSQAQIDQMAASLGIDPATIQGFNTRVATIANAEMDRRNLFLRLARWGRGAPTVVAPAAVPATPVVVTPGTVTESDLMARRAFLVLAGLGIVLAGGGVLWWATHQGETYIPGGTTGGGTSTGGETSIPPSGLDYSSMSVDQANQVLRALPVPDYTGPGQRQALNESIPDDHVGIATGVIVNGVSGGDTVAYEGGETVTADITDGAFYKVPKDQGRDAFVALVVLGQKVYHNMQHAKPLPEWNLQSIG